MGMLRAYPRLQPPPQGGGIAEIPSDISDVEGIRRYLNGQLSGIGSYLQEVSSWQTQLHENLAQREGQIDKFANGGVQYGHAFSGERGFQGNIAEAYRHFIFDLTTTVPPSTQAVCINPRYPDNGAPRGWCVVQAQELAVSDTTRGPVILDQILSSWNPDPSGNGGYSSVTIVDDHTIQGDGVAPDGWLKNDIRVGDTITCLYNEVGAAGTIDVEKDSSIVKGTGTTFTEIPLGAYIALQTPLLQGWKQVVLVLDDLTLVVNDMFEATVAGAAFDVKHTDFGWLRINEVKADPLGAGDILVLAPELDGTVIPVGATGVEYVIRRPPEPGRIWVRVFSETPSIVVATLRIW